MEVNATNSQFRIMYTSNLMKMSLRGYVSYHIYLNRKFQKVENPPKDLYFTEVDGELYLCFSEPTTLHFQRKYVMRGLNCDVRIPKPIVKKFEVEKFSQVFMDRVQDGVFKCRFNNYDTGGV